MCDLACGFYVVVNGVRLELVKEYTGWCVYQNNEEVFCGGYHRALQVIVARIGFGDIY